VLGPEKFGLTVQEVNRCSVIATVPANPDYSSLNLAAAVQLFAYEIRLAALTVGLSARPREFAGRVLPVREAAREAMAVAQRAAVAFVFGTEMSGLSNAELARCGAVATVPANPAYSSLNLAAAVQVAAYELRVAALGGEVWRAPRFPAATHDEIEGLYAHATRTLAAMRFLDPRMPRRLLPRLRRMFARSGFEREEVNILRGILARIDELIDGRHRS
jgi:tRNA/rRNA methyltransferase